jgi:inner membrane protein
VAVQIVLLALAVRWIEKRARGFVPPGTSIAAIAIACLSHPALDLLNSYGIRPWLPLDEEWVYGDTLFIVDPWLWVLFGGASALAGPRSSLGTLLLAATAAGASWVVFGSGRASPGVQWTWAISVGAVALLRASGVGRERPERVALVALGLFVLYLSAMRLLGSAALEKARDQVVSSLDETIEPIVSSSRSPAPGRIDRWAVRIATSRAVYVSMVSLDESLRLRSGDPQRVPNGLGDPLVEEAARSPRARAWRVFARHPIAAVIQDPAGATVHLMDARYQIQPGETWSSVQVEVADRKGSSER